jgi:hypothetical protein
MNSKHTYAIKSHNATAASDYEVNVNWPDSLREFCAKVPGGEERVYALLRGFVAAHHVQSKLKSAFAAEKPSDEQRELMQTVRYGETLEGVEFVPGERGKEDEVVKKLRAAAAAGKLTTEKVNELSARWGGKASGLESLIEVYLDWKRAQAKSKDLGL